MKKYKEIKQLGKGAFGSVVLYEDTETNETYAIKKISVQEKGEDQIKKMLKASNITIK